MELDDLEITESVIWYLGNQIRWQEINGVRELQQLWKSDTSETKWEAIPIVGENGNSKELNRWKQIQYYCQ